MAKKRLKTVIILLAGSIFSALGFAVFSTAAAAQSGSNLNHQQMMICPSFPISASNEIELILAIDCYNAEPAGDYEINLLVDVTLTAALPIINNTSGASLTFNGNNHTIDGAASYRALVIQNSDVTINQLIADNGVADTNLPCLGGTERCGGGIYVATSAAMTLTQSTVSGSTARHGGGIYSSGNITIDSSTISGNTALNNGGGILNYQGSAAIQNSTISGNDSSIGGGLLGDGTTTVEFSTITNNSVTTLGSGVYGLSPIIMYSSLVSDNTGGSNCLGVSADASNIDSDGSCDSATQKTSAEINLGPLQDNGGPTFTHELLVGSDAIDAGTTNPAITADQRGIARPQGLLPDVGAYESVCSSVFLNAGTEAELNRAIDCYNASPADDYTINITADIVVVTNTTLIDNSLGATLTISGNNHVLDGNNIARPIHIKNSDVTIDQLTIQQGFADDTTQCSFVIPNCGGGIYIDETVTLTLTQSAVISSTARYGAGVFLNEGKLIILNSTISGNSFMNPLDPKFGGGLYNRDGSMVVNNSVVSNNSMMGDNFGEGGGIYNTGDLLIENNSLIASNRVDNDGGGIKTRGTITITDSTIDSNYAEDLGGGVNNGTAKSMLVSNSFFTNNQANDDGGAIYSSAGFLTVKDSTLTGNIAYDAGGAMFAFYGKILVESSILSQNFVTGTINSGGGAFFTTTLGDVTINNSTLSDNVSSGDAGAVEIISTGSVTITNSTISNNSAADQAGGILNGNILFVANSTISGNTAEKAGGIWIGIEDEAIIRNSTISGNSATGDPFSQGGGVQISRDAIVFFGNSTITENVADGTIGLGDPGGGIFNESIITQPTNSIIANNIGGDCADTQIGGSHNLDSDGTCASATQSANINLGPLQDNGGATLTHALLPGSDAIDAAFVNTFVPVDQRGVNRGSSPDIGSYEVETTIYVSSSSAGVADGVTFVDEDILAYNKNDDTWMRYFDGSDVGLSGDPFRDLDAFTILNDGSILLSIAGASTIPDVGAIDDSDIVRFIPTKIGPKTEGTYEMYFDGSDVGLDTDKEDIDAIAVLDDGRIVISTLGTAQTLKQFGNTLNSLDEDLIVFTPITLGEDTDGYFSLYADGSDFGLDTP
ncbi:MAG: choice-of-anchor Q domain-containing protein, partial [Chloroflexota bacterium]